MTSEAAGTEADKRGCGHSSEHFCAQELNPTGPCPPPGLLCCSLQIVGGLRPIRTPKCPSGKPPNHSTVTHNPRADLALMISSIIFTLFAKSTCEQVTQLLILSLASLS